MKLKNLTYAAFVGAAAIAFVVGSAVPSEAAKKKKAAAAPPPPPPQACLLTPESRVCAVKGGLEFTYANSCYAARDGAKVVAAKACPVKAAKKGSKKKAKKAAKPAKKKA